MGRARPRLTARVRNGLGNCSAFLDVNKYEESDLLQNIEAKEQEDTIKAIQWLDGMIEWYDDRKGDKE